MARSRCCGGRCCRAIVTVRGFIVSVIVGISSQRGGALTSNSSPRADAGGKRVVSEGVGREVKVNSGGAGGDGRERVSVARHHIVGNLHREKVVLTHRLLHHRVYIVVVIAHRQRLLDEEFPHIGADVEGKRRAGARHVPHQLPQEEEERLVVGRAAVAVGDNGDTLRIVDESEQWVAVEVRVGVAIVGVAHQLVGEQRPQLPVGAAHVLRRVL